MQNQRLAPFDHRWQQTGVDGASVDASVKADEAAVRFRRMVMQMVREEQQEAAEQQLLATL